MSVFGGDSWVREAQQRKRRVDDLLLPDSSSSSYMKLARGKYACLVCPNNPILDTPLMLSMHTKGFRHITAETRLRQGNLSKQEELNKRIALSSDCAGVSNSSTCKSKHPEVCKKPLIEQTQKTILETQNHMPDRPSADSSFTNRKRNVTSPLFDSKFSAASNDRSEPSQNLRHDEYNGSDKISATDIEAAGKALTDWHVELQKRREKELKFTASGWRRDGHGKWYKDENVEFDSDEEDPNDSLK